MSETVVIAAPPSPADARGAGVRPSPRRRLKPTALTLRVIAVVYVGLLVVWPVSLVFTSVIAAGWGAVVETFTDPLVLNALRLTGIATVWAVALNAVFGVGIAMLLVRHRFPGKRSLSALIDVPLSVSPVVVGLSMVLVYNQRDGWLGVPLEASGIQVLFSTPAIVLATAFISLPLVIREVVPVLEELGIEQEQAARSLGAGAVTTFRRITLPAIKWGVTYGVVLCLARAIGEFGAVKIVSGNLIGRTQTATLVVEESYFDFRTEQAFVISAALASVSIVVIIAVAILRDRQARRYS
ncbi:sulfate ABC transporter permease subunit [Demequina sp.]|uniref:sulfate ABC transporter permease subunit n=1 Tax=Demequina sp. TaxID=2050685 RepID=UPI003A84A21A